MVAWVVIDRRHLRQSRNPSAIRPFSFLHQRRLNVWTLRRSDAPFHLPYLLPSSVSRKSFIWRSYENCRGVPTIPILERLHCGRSDIQTCRRFSVFPTYLLFFQTHANSFAMRKMLSHLLSNVSELFAKNHPGWGRVKSPNLKPSLEIFGRSQELSPRVPQLLRFSIRFLPPLCELCVPRVLCVKSLFFFQPSTFNCRPLHPVTANWLSFTSSDKIPSPPAQRAQTHPAR